MAIDVLIRVVFELVTLPTFLWGQLVCRLVPSNVNGSAIDVDCCGPEVCSLFVLGKHCSSPDHTFMVCYGGHLAVQTTQHGASVVPPQVVLLCKVSVVIN